EQLNVSLEDERNHNKILKKKHQAAVKKEKVLNDQEVEQGIVVASHNFNFEELELG
uniref:Uncharacterized protein n=1 Tax=Romanomermis culicivorax TaxID=13658 RepID=A0A915IGG6_ROMCU